ncbi:MAG: hypothetical protein K8R86_06865, partial [Bacteroidales bacterium]|nr:hypothetical protein [Bacteroidales bacterium]
LKSCTLVITTIIGNLIQTFEVFFNVINRISTGKRNTRFWSSVIEFPILVYGLHLSIYNLLNFLVMNLHVEM